MLLLCSTVRRIIVTRTSLCFARRCSGTNARRNSGYISYPRNTKSPRVLLMLKCSASAERGQLPDHGFLNLRRNG
jgi:hypothetical protein